MELDFSVHVDTEMNSIFEFVLPLKGLKQYPCLRSTAVGAGSISILEIILFELLSGT